MYKALLSKEWLKTRRVFWTSLIVSALVAVYAVLKMKSFAHDHGMETLWLTMLQKDVSFVSILTYIPLLVGLALGAAQMMPEMSQKRLKLTLRLPYPTLRLIAVMLGAGLLQLLGIYSVIAAIIAIYDSSILPDELVGRVMLTMLPWFMSGIIAYLFVSAICLEGTWAMRVILGLIGVAVLMTMFLRPEAMAAYNSMILTLVILVLIAASLSFGSVSRFKEGLQD